MTDTQNTKNRNFDSIAQKFDKNIYGTTKGQLRHKILTHNLAPFLDERHGGIALDAGGGTGEFTLELLKYDLQVVLNDISSETLALASDKMPVGAPVSLQHGDIESIHSEGGFDVICCHAVLEWAKSPLACVDHLLSLLKPNGILSLSFFNADANLFGNALYGNFELIKRNMVKKNRLQLANHKPLKPKEVLAYIQEQQVAVELLSGIRCFHDYLRDKSQQRTDYPELEALELKYCTQEPYMWLGKYFQIVVKKPQMEP